MPIRNRTTLVDWKLLKKAINFLDELKREEVARYAVRNASDYIESTGNEAAIKEYRRHKDEKTMGQDSMELFLRNQASEDAASGKNPDALLAVAGFQRLNEKQKKLFFKVLGRRDLLDISKKNLYRNIYNSHAERGFVNEAGRFRLIDEYIDRSMGGNAGITLSDTAYYDAMKSLLSTQVDDTMDFNSIDHVSEVLAGEKCYIFQRDTAVDWKLFTRALQFVNRAEYEMKIREGNAELYRTAGELSKTGHMSMDYSILRRNIHNTGNQFLRFGVQRGKETLGPEILSGIPVFGTIKGVLEVTAKILPQGIADVEKEFISEFFEGKSPEEYTGGKEQQKKNRGPAISQFNPAGAVKKVEEGREKAQGSHITYLDHVRDAFDNIMQNADLVSKGAREVGNAMSLLLADEYATDKVKQEKKKSVIDEQLEGVKTEFRYGDIRDNIASFKAKYKKAESVVKDGKTIVGAGLTVIGLKDKDTELIQFLERKVVESVAESLTNASEKTSGMMPALLQGYERARVNKLEALKKKKLAELIKKGELKKGQSLDPQKIADHKYWKASDEELTDEDKLTAAQDVAKDYFGGLLKGVFGEGTADQILKDAKVIQSFTDQFRETMQYISAIASTAKVYAEAFIDVAHRVQNKSALESGRERAASDATKERDREVIRKGQEKADQTEEQKALLEETVEHHVDLQKIAGDIAENMQNVEIARDVMVAAIQTGVVIANLSGADPSAVKMVSAAVKFGVDFALYAIRVSKDRDALRDYYRNTEQGKAVVTGIVQSGRQLFGEKMDENKHVKDDHVLRLVCGGMGYESEEELMTDTGMKLAASIAYSASKYNPVLQNRIMATTVMIVLGMQDKIGKTDSGTITGIFEAMKAA